MSPERLLKRAVAVATSGLILLGGWACANPRAPVTGEIPSSVPVRSAPAEGGAVVDVVPALPGDSTGPEVPSRGAEPPRQQAAAAGPEPPAEPPPAPPVSTMREAMNPRLSAAEKRRVAYVAQMEGDTEAAAAWYESLRQDGELDVESAIRYAWLLNEDAAYADALELLTPFRDDPAVTRLFERTAFWADVDPAVADPARPRNVTTTEVSARDPGTADRAEAAGAPAIIPGLVFDVGAPSADAPGFDPPSTTGEVVPLIVEGNVDAGRERALGPGPALLVSPEFLPARLDIETLAAAARLTGRPSVDPAVEARVRRAETLWSEGRTSSAVDVLQADEEALGVHRDPVTAARVARINARELEAQRALAVAATRTPSVQTSPDHHLLLAEIASARGDYRTASASVREARDRGADAGQLERVQRDIDRATRPRMRSGADGTENAIGVRWTEAWGEVALRPMDGGLRLLAGARRMQLLQGGTIRQATLVTGTADSLFAIDAALVSGGAFLSLEDAGPTLPGGFISVDLETASGSRLFARFSHDPAWRPVSRVDPLGPLRLRDVGRMDRSLLATDYRVGASFRRGLQGQIRLEGGGTSYNDGSRRTFAYGHWRIPVLENRFRLALEPNGYVEIASGQPSGLFMPSGYLALGGRVRTEFGVGAGRFVLSANPHFFDYPTVDGFGLSAELDATIGLGPLDLLIDGRLLEQEIDAYAHVGVGLSVPIW